MFHARYAGGQPRFSVIDPRWYGSHQIPHLADVATPKGHFAPMTPGQKAL